MDRYSGAELLVVHCVDAEGPLDETTYATFERLKYIFNIDVHPSRENFELLVGGGIETGNLELDNEIQRTFGGDILNYNRDWQQVDQMLSQIFSDEFRFSQTDDFGNAWKISWFCLDHLNYLTNPRNKDMGHSKVMRHYKELIDKFPKFNDEIQWHFHPKSITKNSIAAATSYSNSMQEIIEIFSRKIIDDLWFPTCYRPGFHSERQDSNLFLEQWIPFDYGNQKYDEETSASDMLFNRFGNWKHAPKTWRGYHPDAKHYDQEGGLNRIIFRCLNLGTRLRLLETGHIIEAMEEASAHGFAIVAFTDHDFRDIAPDIEKMRVMLEEAKAKFPNIRIRYCTAEEAAQRILGKLKHSLELNIKLIGSQLVVSLEAGEIFGSQPFLAIKTKAGLYLHDNLDFDKSSNCWYYTFDDQTIALDEVSEVGVASAGRFGGYSVKKLAVAEVLSR
jgi:hypothetical protein